MGLMNNIREFFSGSKNSHATQAFIRKIIETSVIYR